MGSLTLPSTGEVYVDSPIVIYSVEKNPTYFSALIPLWAAVQAGSIGAVSSTLLITETLVGPYLAGDTNGAQNFEGFFTKPGFRLIDVSHDVLRKAAEIRATYGFRTPDAIHASTALLSGCKLFLTNDRRLTRLQGISIQVLDDILQP